MDKKSIKNYLERELMIIFDKDGISADTNLFEDGILDSFGFVQLITYLEVECQIVFSDEEMTKAPLNSLNGICAVLKEKTGAAVD
jgi:D-alanine--poly(phosphoribitol) ligase subunit 2